MQFGFQTQAITASTSDGRNFVIEEPVCYIAKDGRIFLIPAGATTDGASTPRPIWTVIPPFGKYWMATVLHDSAYRNTLETIEEGRFVKATLPKEQCDALLLEAMEFLGVEQEMREAIFEGVNYCGESSFERDRAKAVDKI